MQAPALSERSKFQVSKFFRLQRKASKAKAADYDFKVLVRGDLPYVVPVARVR